VKRGKLLYLEKEYELWAVLGQLLAYTATSRLEEGEKVI